MVPGKKTPEDEALMVLVETKCVLPVEYRAQRYQLLFDLRSNTSTMTTKEMFVKDLKYAVR